MKMRKSLGRKWFTLLTLVGLLIIGGFLLMSRTTSAQEGGILQLSDLPEGFTIVFEDKYVAAANKEEDRGHPLTAVNLYDFSSADQQQIFAYTSRQSFGALQPDVGVLVASFSYEYTTEAQAEQAAQILQQYILQINETAARVESPGKVSPDTRGLRGQGLKVKGEEDEDIYWFYGCRGKTLVLLLFDGLDSTATSSAYQDTMAKLLNK